MTGIVIEQAAFESLLAVDAQLVRLAGGAAWAEGPVWLPREQALVYSDIPNDRMFRWHAQDGLGVFRQPSNFANGHTLDGQRRLISCEHGARRISRTEPDGRIVTLADRYQGRRFNSPNDVVAKSDGSIWFTDPPYGIVSDYEGHAAPSELGGNYLFRLEPDIGALAIASDAFEAPNGLAFSPDESVLYVSDTGYSLGGANHHIVAFDVVDGARLANGRVFAVVEPGRSDGFRIDEHGNLWTSSDDSIQEYAPDGVRLGRILVPERVSNCAFGGAYGRTLFVTASTSLYAIELAVRSAVDLR